MNLFSTKDFVILKWIFSLSLLFSLCLSVFLLILNGTGITCIPILVVILLLGNIYLKYALNNNKPYSWLLIIIIFNMLIVIPELLLRVIDFHHESKIQYMKNTKFGALRPEHYKHFIPDKDLFWKLPSANPNVNSLGFPGPEITTPKPAHTYRILYLGDSVTQLGYSQYVQMFLNSYPAPDSLAYECVALAVSGYSSYQGKILAELYGSELNPDLVVVMFGWNDHWLAYLAKDSDFNTVSSGNILWKVYHNLRTLQFANKLIESIKNSYTGAIIKQVRVPKEEYHNNLIAIKNKFKSSKVPVVFMTAPTSHYSLGVPDYLVLEHYIPSQETALALHREYNQIVRTTAQSECAYLIDLEWMLDSTSNLQEIFHEDGIHLTPYGLKYVGGIIYTFISENILNN